MTHRKVRIRDKNACLINLGTIGKLSPILLVFHNLGKLSPNLLTLPDVAATFRKMVELAIQVVVIIVRPYVLNECKLFPFYRTKNKYCLEMWVHIEYTIRPSAVLDKFIAYSPRFFIIRPHDQVHSCSSFSSCGNSATTIT